MRLFLCLFLSLFVGCSVASLAIGNLDWILARKIKTALDLYYNQEKELDIDVGNFLERQKKHIPAILEIFNEIDKRLDAKTIVVTDKDIQQYRARVITIYEAVADDMNKSILSKFIAQLNKNQQDHFAKENTRINLEIQEKMEESKPDDLLKQVEYFVGDFTDKQKQMIKSKVPNAKILQKLRLKRRKRLQNNLYQVLSVTVPDKRESVRQYMHQYIRKLDMDEEEKKVFETNRNEINNMLKEIASTVTVEQKKKIKSQIQWLRDTLKSYNKVNFRPATN
jgi:hypothetical protein